MSEMALYSSNAAKFVEPYGAAIFRIMCAILNISRSYKDAAVLAKRSRKPDGDRRERRACSNHGGRE
jgi:hypothetical protein